MKEKIYPSIPQSWGIFGIAILGMFAFIPVNQELSRQFGEEFGMMVYYILSMSLPLSIAHFLRRKINGSSSYSFYKGSLHIYLLLIISMISIQIGFTLPLGNLLPMPDFMKDIFSKLSQYNGIYGFITIVIAAPIIEEWIFRGIILDGLLKRYSPLKSILFSSFLFGIVHLNPWQFISAMIIGSFSGWIYFRTRNLGYSIFIHFINNLIPFIAMVYMPADEMMDMELSDYFGGLRNTMIVILVAILVSIICIIQLKKSLHRSKITSESR